MLIQHSEAGEGARCIFLLRELLRLLGVWGVYINELAFIGEDPDIT
jgi:hypothetical protein